MKFLTVLLLISAAVAKHEEYAGWKAYNVEPKNNDAVRHLHRVADTLELDFLAHPVAGREAVVLVKPAYQSAFIKIVEDLDIIYNVYAEDVAEALRKDDEQIELRNNQTRNSNDARMPYNNYQRQSVIDSYLQDIARRYPDTVTLVTPTNSFEGRPIHYLKISTTNFEDLSKPVIFIDGGIHAREWISPPTVTWAIHKLVEDITEPDLLERFDWILLPVVNPDGYEFTHTNSRMWRKTRSTNTAPMSGICPGVDGNRNFDFFWNTVGTSSNVCSDVYAGNQAFSEIETRVVRDILHEHLDRMALYITMHSYGSMILYPWGHDGSLPDDSLNLHSVGTAMAGAIQQIALPFFPRYIVGNGVLILAYGASGASEDYAYSIGVPLSYTFELPGLSSGWEGFMLHPGYIAQVCIETWAGIVVGARRAGDLFNP